MTRAAARFDLGRLPARLRDAPEVQAFGRAVEAVRDLLQRERIARLPQRVALLPAGPVGRAPAALSGSDPATLGQGPRLVPLPEDATAIGRILQSPEMLTVEELARHLGLSRQSIAERRRRGDVLALPRDRRNWRYPALQLGPEGILPGLGEIVRAVGQGWPTWRFLMTRHGGLGGLTGIEALKAGRAVELLRLAPGFGTDFA